VSWLGAPAASAAASSCARLAAVFLNGVSGWGMVGGATYLAPFAPFFFPLAGPFPFPVAGASLSSASVFSVGVAFGFLFALSAADSARLRFSAGGGCR
jgi:hypothetical protein